MTFMRRPRLEVRPADPGAVDNAISEVERTLTRLKTVYSSQRQHDWEKYARNLRSRIQNQRTELRRLNDKMRWLRADAHEATERADNLETIVGLYVQHVDRETVVMVEQAYHRAQAEARRERAATRESQED